MELTIQYPETLPDALRQTRDQFEREAKMAMAVKLFEMGRIPSGIAASLMDLDRVTFLFKLGDYGVSMIQADEDELAADLTNA